MPFSKQYPLDSGFEQNALEAFIRSQELECFCTPYERKNILIMSHRVTITSDASDLLIVELSIFFEVRPNRSLMSELISLGNKTVKLEIEKKNRNVKWAF